MKILLYGLNFSPEPTGIGKYTGEMAAWLAARGHEVRVVTTPPYYPHWKVGEGYSAWRYEREKWQGVCVWRCPLWVPAKQSGLKRVLHLFSFALSSLPVLARQIFWKPDVVWTVAPAFACTPAALLTAKLSGAPAWLHVQDYEVDLAFDMGLLNGKLARILVTGAESWLLRRFNVMSSISKRMLKRAAEKGVVPERIGFFPNWVDVSAITPQPAGTSPYRAELGIESDAVVALFSGTLGAKQGLHLLPEAAKVLAEQQPKMVIVICGDGVMQPELEAACKGMPNVRLLPLQPKERLNDLLAAADIHLLPQDVSAADLVMPSKLAAMLSSGRPVVTTAHAGTELAEVVSLCGLVAEPGNAAMFFNALVKLGTDAEQREVLGANARHYAEEHLSAERALGRFEHDAQALIHKQFSGVTV